MKAIVYHTYGSPDVLRLEEIAKPEPGDNDVLIKIQAAAVTATDSTFRRGNQLAARSFTGLLKPKYPILGDVLAGDVEAVGKDVTAFKPGDQVFGSSNADFGAHAEYKSLPEDGPLALKPTNLTYAEAVAVSDGALTALPFLRDAANIQPGQTVLINGASGSIGTAAVQLAKHFGAHVTGVCSTKNVDLIKSLGADEVIDYTAEDFTRRTETYDLIFDTVGKRTFSQSKRALKPGGIYLSTVLTPGILLQMLWTSRIGRKQAKITFAGLRSPAEKGQDLKLIKDLAEAGTLKPVIDQCYPLEQIAEAYRHVETGHKTGNIIIAVDH